MLSAGRGRSGRCAGLLGLCRRRCADDDLGAASFLEEHHRRHFYFGAADGKKADFMHFRQCELAFNAKGGGKASTVYDAIGAAQVAKASFAGMRLLHHLGDALARSEEHTSELQSIMRNSYAVFCLQKT